MHTILGMLVRGKSVEHIAAAAGSARATVQRYADLFHGARTSQKRVDAFFGTVLSSAQLCEVVGILNRNEATN